MPNSHAAYTRCAAQASGAPAGDVVLAEDFHVELDASALGAFGAGDFSIELTYRGTGRDERMAAAQLAGFPGYRECLLILRLP